MDLAPVIVIGLAFAFLLFEGGQAMLWWSSRRSKGPNDSSKPEVAENPEGDEVNPAEVRNRIEEELKGLRHQQQLLEYQLTKITLGKEVNDGS